MARFLHRILSTTVDGSLPVKIPAVSERGGALKRQQSYEDIPKSYFQKKRVL